MDESVLAAARQMFFLPWQQINSLLTCGYIDSNNKTDESNACPSIIFIVISTY